MSNMGNAPSQPLAALHGLLCEDLDFHGANGGSGTHAWHPFPAKFPPQLPGLFIKGLTAPGDVVLDPMFGSGTTIVEAVRLGRVAVGCDIDPLARLVACAKLAPLDAEQMLRLGHAIVEQAKRGLSERPREPENALNERFDGRTRAFVDYWFRPTQQLELMALLRAIECRAPEGARNFLHMVFSSTIIAKSGGVSLARDLAHTRPHRVLEKKPKCAFDEFAKRLQGMLAAVAGAEHGGTGRILARSAEDTGLPSASVDLIVTSPPYANNAIDYMRAHKFSLVWLGWKIDELSDLRARYLGHDARGQRAWSGLPDQCEATLRRLARLDERKATALRRYFGEMSAVVKEMYRVLKPGKAAIIVVGSSTLRGMDVETHKGLAAVGTWAGFQLARIGVRRLDRDKRMMPARWGRGRESQIEHRMHEEHVIGLVKPATSAI